MNKKALAENEKLLKLVRERLKEASEREKIFYRAIEEASSTEEIEEALTILGDLLEEQGDPLTKYIRTINLSEFILEFNIFLLDPTTKEIIQNISTHYLNSMTFAIFYRAYQLQAKAKKEEADLLLRTLRIQGSKLIIDSLEAKNS